MSISTVTSQPTTTPLKRAQSHKRKHDDVSQSPAVPDSQPSPTKKSKQKHTLDGTTLSGSKPSAITLPDTDSSANSPFFVRTLSLYLPLSPIAQASAVAGLCAEHLSPLLLTYYPALQGVILSYSNPRLSESPDNQSSGPVLAVSIAEYGASFVWLTADFLVLDPKQGTPIEGWVNLQSEGHVGLVCWNLFEATIERGRLPQDWTWVPAGAGSKASKGRKKDKLKGSEDSDDAMDVDAESATVQPGPAGEEDDDRHGHYVDGSGDRIRAALVFRVVELDAQGVIGEASSGFVKIRGTLLDEEAEKAKLMEEHEEWERKQAKRTAKPKRKQQMAMSGAHPEVQVNGDQATDQRPSSPQTERKKKKVKISEEDGSKKKSKKKDTSRAKS